MYMEIFDIQKTNMKNMFFKYQKVLWLKNDESKVSFEIKKKLVYATTTNLKKILNWNTPNTKTPRKTINSSEKFRFSPPTSQKTKTCRQSQILLNSNMCTAEKPPKHAILLQNLPTEPPGSPKTMKASSCRTHTYHISNMWRVRALGRALGRSLAAFHGCFGILVGRRM